MNNNVAILVNSCDKYKDAWFPFFKLISILWKDYNNYNIYLNIEEGSFECDFLNVKCIKSGKNKSWSERVKYSLSEIEEDYIIFMLEDYFLMDTVNTDLLTNLINEVQKNTSIGFLWFPPYKNEKTYASEKRVAANIYETKRSFEDRVNATIGIWRKEFLSEIVSFDFNAWDFEIYGSLFSRYSKYKCTYYDNQTVFNYSINPKYGIGITGGKWLNKNSDLFAKYNISTDFDNLGVFETTQTYTSMSKQQKKRKLSLRSVLKNIIRNIRRIRNNHRLIKKFIMIEKNNQSFLLS